MNITFDIVLEQIVVESNSTPSGIDPSGIDLDFTPFMMGDGIWWADLPMLMNQPKYGTYKINGTSFELKKRPAGNIVFDINGPNTRIQYIPAYGVVKSVLWEINGKRIDANEIWVPTDKITAKAKVIITESHYGNISVIREEISSIEIILTQTEFDKEFIETAGMYKAVLAYFSKNTANFPDLGLDIKGCNVVKTQDGCYTVFTIDNYEYEFKASGGSSFVVAGTRETGCTKTTYFYFDLDALTEVVKTYLSDSGLVLETLESEMFGGCFSGDGFVARLQALIDNICLCCSGGYGYYYNGQPIGFD